MRSVQYILRATGLIVAVVLNSVLVLAADSPGIVTAQPKEGRFVKIGNGYMVPYQVRIPGTEDTFWMEPIPPGRFAMGSPETEAGRSDIEGPQTVWSVEPFWMARCEVTQGQYRHYMALYTLFRSADLQSYVKVTDKNRVDSVTAPTTLYEPGIIFENGDHNDMPMITMTLFAAKQYSKWLSRITGSQFRLPTEAEWEYACRAGTTTAYHFGDDPSQLSEYAWFKDNSYDFGLRKVGTKKPNPWGLYDMHGNVAEWVHDHCVKYSTSDRVRNASHDWKRYDKVDPKAARGGGWLFDAEQCRSASRLTSDMHGSWGDMDPDLPMSPWWLTSEPSISVGFRLIRPLKEMSLQEKQDFWEASNETTRQDVEIRVQEARGAIGFVDQKLPKMIETLPKE